MAFGNVNVKYSPCKSVGQLKSAEKYMLGKKPEQVKAGVVKTAPDLYFALGCCRDNFANNVLVTRKLHNKSYSKTKANDVLAYKMSISFHPDDNAKLNYRKAFEIAQQFAEKFAHEKGHEILFAVHTDTPHKHVHFLISNCNFNTGKSYRRNKKDLYEMSKCFGELCLEHGLTNSVRDEFYNKDLERQQDRITPAEKKIRERGQDSFKDELREVIREEIQNLANKTFDDVINALYEKYKVECRVAGNTISYRHPEYRNKKGEFVSVRGSKLGELYTRKGIEYELNQKQIARAIAHAPRGIETSALTDVDVAGARPTIGGGQVSSGVVVSDNGADVRSVNDFYERYRKPLEVDERKADEPAQTPRRVRSHGAR
jgi:hypothetical protein